MPRKPSLRHHISSNTMAASGGKHRDQAAGLGRDTNRTRAYVQPRAVVDRSRQNYFRHRSKLANVGIKPGRRQTSLVSPWMDSSMLGPPRWKPAILIMALSPPAGRRDPGLLPLQTPPP